MGNSNAKILAKLDKMEQEEKKREQKEKKREHEEKKRKTIMLKIDGKYFTITTDLWEKQRVFFDRSSGGKPDGERDQAASSNSWEREGKEAVDLISASIKATEDPFLSFCQLPSEERIRQHFLFHSTFLRVPNPEEQFQAVKQRFQNLSDGAKKKNIFGTEAAAGKRDSHATGFNSLAHAVPQDLVCSMFWPYFLEILTGEKDGTEWQRFCAVHGLLEGEESECLGVKNVPQNLLALPPDHAMHFDGSHSGDLLVIPIIDLQSSNHEGPAGIKSKFDLLVVGRSTAVNRWIYAGHQDPGFLPFYVDSVDEFVQEATEDDVKIATQFLATYVKAGVYLGLVKLKQDLDNNKWGDENGVEAWLGKILEEKKPKDDAFQRSGSESENSASSRMGRSASKSKDGVWSKMKSLRSAFGKMKEKDRYFCIPKLADHFDSGKNKVMKVKLLSYFDRNGIPPDEYYPSWSLFGSKAMSGWCKYAGHAFITSCRDQDPDQDAVSLTSVDVSLNSASSALSDEEEWDEQVDDELDGGTLSYTPTSPPAGPPDPPAAVTP